jgi:CCR4-NOT transcriptional regulation complex NOT5 subunit
MVRNVLPDKVLMYIFYNMPNDRQQLVAAETLTVRGWTYIVEDMRWVKMKMINNQPRFIKFNPDTWSEEPLV